MWSLIIFTGFAALTSTLNNAEAHRIKRQVYRNYGYQNTGYGNNNNYYTNTGYANNALNNAAWNMEYYHSLWDQMHESALGAIPPMDPFGQPPPIDPFAPPPPDMDPFAPPPPGMDPFAPPPPGMDPFAPPPGMDPFAPPPPDMDPFAPPPPDPAFDEWAHRMGWIADPAPPPDPAMEDYMRRLAWEHLAFDPTVESQLFHGFGFSPNGWLYEHYIPEDYVLSNYG